MAELQMGDIVAAWDTEQGVDRIHPLRRVSEEAYATSGVDQAKALDTVLPVGATVVDFGCGDGRVTAPLRSLGYKMIGADSSRLMLSELRRRRPGTRTVQSDGLDLAAALGHIGALPVDAVICLAVLIHHSYADGAAIVAGLRAAVRPGGVLVLDWPVSPYPEERSHWVGVTTWSAQHQRAITDPLGMYEFDRVHGWPVYRVE